MLKIHTPIQTEYAQDARAILKTFDYQRAAFSKLEFLVREATQNALDASRNYNVKIEYNLTTFEGEALMAHLESLNEDSLRPTGLCLEIRDHGKGLNGPMNNQDPSSSGGYLALVARIGENLAGQEAAQEEIGSGGSFGHGKTLLYHFGIGVVLFYSRLPPTDPDNPGQERLGVCFVKNNTAEQHLQGSSLQNLHLWGDVVMKPYGEGNIPYHQAITDPTQIHPILQALDVTPFAEGEHGTSVVIPWFNLDQDIIQEYEEHDLDSLQDDLNEDLCYALDRFYPARLIKDDEHFLISGDRHKKLSTEYFKELGKLAKVASKMIESNEPGEITGQLHTTWCKASHYNNEFKLGVLTLKKLKRDAMRIWETSFPVTEPSEKEGSPAKVLIAYSRAFGMNVNFWTEEHLKLSMLDLKEDEVLLGFFMLADQINLPNYPIFEKYQNVGKLFRFYENNMHVSWNTNQKTKEHKVYHHLESEVSAYVRDHFCHKVRTVSSTPRFNPASRLVMEKLFPEGFGPGRGAKRRTSTGSGSGTHTAREYKSLIYTQADAIKRALERAGAEYTEGDLACESWLIDKQKLPCTLMVNPKVVGLGALSAWEYDAQSFPLKVAGVYLSSTEPNAPTNVQKLKVTPTWPEKKGPIKLKVERQNADQPTEGYVSVVFKLNAPNLKPDISEVKLYSETQAENQGGEA